MKNTFKFVLIIAFSFLTFQSCTDKDDNLLPNEIRVYDFVWRGMNQYYYWQSQSPDLSDTKFANQGELNAFYGTYNDPTVFFNHLRIDNAIDRFSVIFSDYRVLQGLLQGNTLNNGVNYGLKYKTSGSPAIFGFVRYILPNSDATSKNIARGTIFYAVNGIPLDDVNYKTLLANDTYTLNLANYDNGNITPNGQSVTLTKSQYSENPVYFTNVINLNANHKVGYLIYNGFYPDYDGQLNNAFGNLKNAGATDLILDLRYNSGGSINSATRLASMITGQFTGQLFAKEEWNSKIQSQSDPNNFLNLFTNTLGDGTAINSLSLNKVYVITSKKTASASELVINCLKPYIQLTQIGDVTVGKNVGSVTLYDSPNFSFSDVNPNHRYAMQPIVLKTINKDNFGDYQDGIIPNYSLVEDIGNLGVLGSVTEPLLSTALGHVLANNRMKKQSAPKTFDDAKDNQLLNDVQNQMYLEKIPAGIFK